MAKTDAFLYFIIASILSSIASLLKWAAAALMTAYFTVSYGRARRRFRASIPDDSPAVRRWLAGQRLRRPLEVRQSALVSSPLTYGGEKHWLRASSMSIRVSA